MSATLRGVRVSYPATADHARPQGLENIELCVARAERLAIIGPSGAGKSTLLRLLATAQQPAAGNLSLLDTNPWAISTRARQRLRTRIGLIQQAPPLPPRQRVVTAVSAGRAGHWPLWKSLSNLIYPLDIPGVVSALSRVDLADKLFARCDQLSGGQLQRAAIARALYQQPELLLADEPVSAMDPVLAQHTLEVLSEESWQRDATLIVSLHNLELALRCFPRVIGLRDGRILFDKATANIEQSELDALYANEQLQPVQSQQAHNQSLAAPRC